MTDTLTIPGAFVMEVPAMSDPAAPQRRELPTTTLQLAGHATTEVVEGIGKTPLMLGVIILNLIGVGAAVFFLNLLISGQQEHLRSLLTVQQHQQSEIVQMHKQEFDQLLGMIPRVEAHDAPSATVVAPPPAIPASPPATPLPGARR